MTKKQLRLTYASMLVFAVGMSVYAATLITDPQPVIGVLILVSAVAVALAGLWGLRKIR